ncbi:ABC transporter ATP-binding protein [Algisphaera agarilytica]|uniref:ABC-type oligopeptide transport system ATPase subunit n=1 Tax=Algisphaera agarilytica TaxID=1385975 RepID=A0A7X0H6N1_9BACT|nr:oligopeptide/dipeptide ABC transporter ATP-binding protein [Algisphaera agarilytica]MBB6430286.1 ABC-type oligopeptide transport system ATPase subunit [Algisphaera agarilytica]
MMYPSMIAPDPPLLSVKNLKTYFPVKRGLLKSHVGDVRAVDDVSFDIAPNETLGLVGESGCGKSTVGRSILRLIPTTSGSVHYNGEDVLAAPSGRMKQLRREMQIIFQDPVGSLNPRMAVGKIIGEPMAVHRVCPKEEIPDRVADLLVKVGLRKDHAARYPHEFSGGQRQRIGIARALALSPKFIVCDEPVSALDVSVQSQVLNLLNDLQDEFGLSYLFIAHNLAVVEHFCDRVAVMYLGRIVELADRDTLYRNPLHPYTKALLSAAPMPDPDAEKRRIMLLGDVPSPIRLFKDDGKADTGITPEEQAELDAERQPGVEYITRHSLLHRPDLVPVDGEPGHFVSPSVDA